jgi:hypothetical protein
MGFQINQFALFMVCFIGLIAFSAYSIRTVRRTSIARYLWNLLLAVKKIVGTMSKVVMGFVGLLASYTDTSDEEENDISAGAYRGGTLNYRTGKLDDGTDPYGWYEKD